MLLDDWPIGLGLWNYITVSHLIEGLIFLAGLGIYLKSTTDNTVIGKYGIIIFSTFLLAVSTLNVYGPQPPDVKILAAFGLVYCLLFASIAFWLDGKRW